jgi:HPt (histidine-containing phosphotransfer) domain-containing protein
MKDAMADPLAERLAALQALGEQTGHDMSELVPVFLQQGEADLAAVRDALLRQDGKKADAAAHSLAGSSGVLGAAELAQAAAELAALARQGDLTACAARLPALEGRFQEIVRRLTP